MSGYAPKTADLRFFISLKMALIAQVPSWYQSKKDNDQILEIEQKKLTQAQKYTI